MINAQEQVLKNELDELSERLHKWTEEFKKSGEFSEVNQALLRGIQDRSDALRKRVRQAEEQGSIWELLKAEFVRDVSSLQDDLLELEDRLDSETMKRRKS